MNDEKIEKLFAKIICSDSECISSSDIYAFITNSVDEKRREKIEEHLLICPSCMEQWREMRQFIQTDQAASQPSPVRMSSRVVALAASLLLAVSLGILLGRTMLPSYLSDITGPQKTIFVDLYPTSMVFRGTQEPTAYNLSKATNLLSMLLNHEGQFPDCITVSLLSSTDEIVWQRTIDNPDNPLNLVMPIKDITEGEYRILVKDIQDKPVEEYQLSFVENSL